MKTMNFWRALFFSALAVTAFTGCKDDDDDANGEVRATITVDGKSAVNVAVKDVDESFDVKVVSSGDWALSYDDAAQDWLEASATTGRGGESTVTFTVKSALPEGETSRTVKATLQTRGFILGTEYWAKATVAVTQSESGDVGGETVVIYNTTVGTGDVTSNPFVTDYSAWDATGTGAADVTYAYTGKVSVRSSGMKNTGAYTGASGPNVVFFGTAPSTFTIGKIALTDSQTNLQLTFGASSSVKDGDVYNNTFDMSKFEVALSADGEKWSTIEYTTNGGDAASPYWIFATADFTLSKAASELYIRFSASLSSAIRLDDITLQTGLGGQAVDLEVGDPEPIVDYTKITSVNALGDGDYELEGATIVGVHSKGVMFGDATGYVLAFNNDWATQTANPYQADLDKTATIKGTSAQRYGLYQFSDFEVTVGEASSFTLPEPETFDATAITAYADAIKADESAAAYKYVALSGALNIETGSSYNTYTLEVAGLNGVTVQFAYGLDSYFDGLASGDAVDAKGFALGFDTSNNKMNVLLRSIEKNTTTTTVSFTSKPETFAAASPAEQTLNFVAQNLPESTLVDFAFTGDNADKFAVVSQTETTVTIKAVGDNTSEAAYTATLTASVNNEVLDQVNVKQAMPNGNDTRGTYTSMSIFESSGASQANPAGLGNSKVGDANASGVKLGTSSKVGTFTSGALGVTGSKKLGFYALGWKGKSNVPLKITVNGGGSASVTTFTLRGDDGATGNPPFASLTVTDDDYFVTQLSDLTATSTITFETTEANNGRAVIFGVQLFD